MRECATELCAKYRVHLQHVQLHCAQLYCVQVHRSLGGIWGKRSSWQEAVEEILGEEGNGEEWLRKLKEWRRRGGIHEE